MTKIIKRTQFLFNLFSKYLLPVCCTYLSLTRLNWGEFMPQVHTPLLWTTYTETKGKQCRRRGLHRQRRRCPPPSITSLSTVSRPESSSPDTGTGPSQFARKHPTHLKSASKSQSQLPIGLETVSCYSQVFDFIIGLFHSLLMIEVYSIMNWLWNWCV